MVGDGHALASEPVTRPCLLAIIGAAGVGSLVAHAPAAAPELRAVARPAPFAGIVANPVSGVRTRVGCFDALSLRPTSAPVVIFEYHDAWSASPDGTRVAVGMSAPGREGRIGVQVVDLVRGTIELEVMTGIAAEAVAWLTERRLVAALQRGGIVLIDPVSGAIVKRWAGWRVLDAVATRTRRRFVMLEPGQRARLAAVDRSGRLRSVSLRLAALGRRGRAALVADPVGEHAYVLTGGRTAVDVDLRRMRVGTRRLRPEPRAGSEKGPKPGEVRQREGIWLGDGLLAISGRDFFPRGRRGARTVPAGASTIDTKSWAVRRVDAKATGVASAPGRLIAYGQRGLRAYTLHGRRVFEALRRNPLWSVGAAGRLAYAGTPTATHVIDTGSGHIRGRISDAHAVSVISRRCPTATR